MSPPQTGIAYVHLAGTLWGVSPLLLKRGLKHADVSAARYRAVRLGGFPHRARRSGGKLDCGRRIVLSQA
jgi:hypothetical protein